MNITSFSYEGTFFFFLLGVFLLDLESTDLKSIAHNIVEQMDIYDLIQPEDKGNVLRTLLLKHK